MRLDELFADGLREGMDDHLHAQALRDTGFWGAQGAGCVFMARSTGRFLIAHRSEHVQEPGSWGTWGGAIDRGEDPAEAAQREAREETGYDGDFEVIPLYVFKRGSFRYSNFLVLVDEEFTPKLDWETQGYRWCAWGDWPSPLHFGFKALLNDAESARKMQAAAAEAQRNGERVDEFNIPFLRKKPQPRTIERIQRIGSQRIRVITPDGIYEVQVKMGLPTAPWVGAKFREIWEITRPDGSVYPTDFKTAEEAIAHIRSGEPV